MYIYIYIYIYILVEILLTKVGQYGRGCLSIVTYFSPKSGAVRHYLAGTPNLPSSCPSLVYLADMYGIYKSYVPLLIKETSFEVKHCKIETAIISRAAQAAKLKKTYT